MRLRMPRHALAAALLTITAALALAGCGTASARPATAPELTDLTVMAVPAEGTAGSTSPRMTASSRRPGCT